MAKKIEDRPYWPEIVALKDDLSLRQLGERYGVSSAAVNNAFKRNGIERKPAKPGRKRDVDLQAVEEALAAVVELPPEAGEGGDGDAAGGTRRYVRPDKVEVLATDAPPKKKRSRGKGKKKGRGGAPSKAPLIEPFKDKLGQVPDGDIAELAGVNPRTVAKYRKSLGIAAYSGHQEKFSDARKAASLEAAARPKKKKKKRKSTRRRRTSKIDPYIDRLGTVPDREIAELAGVSAEAVRVFRSRHGIPSLRDRRRAERQGNPLPPPAVKRGRPVASASPKSRKTRVIGMRAWKATLKGGEAVVVVARDLVGAATLLGPEREVESLEALGRAIV